MLFWRSRIETCVPFLVPVGIWEWVLYWLKKRTARRSRAFCIAGRRNPTFLVILSGLRYKPPTSQVMQSPMRETFHFTSTRPSPTKYPFRPWSSQTDRQRSTLATSSLARMPTTKVQSTTCLVHPHHRPDKRYTGNPPKQLSKQASRRSIPNGSVRGLSKDLKPWRTTTVTLS